MKPSECEPYFPLVTEACLQYREACPSDSVSLWTLLEKNIIKPPQC